MRIRDTAMHFLRHTWPPTRRVDQPSLSRVNKWLRRWSRFIDLFTGECFVFFFSPSPPARPSMTIPRIDLEKTYCVTFRNILRRNWREFLYLLSRNIKLPEIIYAQMLTDNAIVGLSNLRRIIIRGIPQKCILREISANLFMD